MEIRRFGHWCDIYAKMLEARDIKASTRRDKIRWLCVLRAEFEERDIESILPFELVNLVERIKQAGKESAARCIVITVKDLLYEAWLANWVTHNRAQYIRKPRPAVKRQRLSLEHWRVMRDATVRLLLPHHRVLLDLALVTGQRRADLSAMRFDHVWDGHLHIHQQKTGRRIALPLSLTLHALNLNLKAIIMDCRKVGASGPTLLRTANGDQATPIRLTGLFRSLRTTVLPTQWARKCDRPPLHEVRSLAERLYRIQGVDTQLLLGHKYPTTTLGYNDDRGLNSAEWKYLPFRSPENNVAIGGPVEPRPAEIQEKLTVLPLSEMEVAIREVATRASYSWPALSLNA